MVHKKTVPEQEDNIKIQMLCPGQLIRTLFTDPFYCSVLLTVTMYTKDKDWEQPDTKSAQYRWTVAVISHSCQTVWQVTLSDLFITDFYHTGLCFKCVCVKFSVYSVWNSLFVFPQGFLAELQWRNCCTKREFHTKMTMTLEDSHFICLFQAAEA